MAPFVYDTPYDKLSNPRQVWVSEPSSHEEGMGKLSLLTPELDLTKLEYAGLRRSKSQHHILPIMGGMAFDDIYLISPQITTQWDGLRHCSQSVPAKGDEPPPDRVFYGGTTTAETQNRIAGRRVLIDYASYAEKKGIKYSTFKRHEIKLSAILEIAKEYNIDGMTKEWDNDMSVSDKAAFAASPMLSHAGVEATEDIPRFLWNNGFSAVAGDGIAFELAQTCKEMKRWSFFLTSVLLN
ncbi:hypothetical protein BDR22DRAFT_883633 [Usnea florida]